MSSERVLLGILYGFLLLAACGAVGYAGFVAIDKAKLGRVAEVLWGVFCLIVAAVLLILFATRWPGGTY